MIWTLNIWLKVACPCQLLHVRIQGILLNRLDESVELMCAIAPQVSHYETVHPALTAVYGCEVGVEVKMLLLHLLKPDLGPGA